MNRKTKSVAVSPEVVAFVNDLKAAIGRHQHLSAQEMLAGASQLVGNLIALQDQNTMTSSDAMHMVEVNIQIGNEEAIKTVLPQGKRD
jgi:hypothetical protein